MTIVVIKKGFASVYCENEDEHEIRTLADEIYRYADWKWACNGGANITHG
jgi:hypothetical protein